MRSLVPLLACSSLAAPSAAQAELQFADGVLGSTVYYDVKGDPFELFGVAPSLSEGPTPLSLFDPGDPRVLDVGLELLAFWEVDVLDASGAGTIAYPLPADPAIAGVTLYAQAVTAPGTTTLVDEITERVQFTLALEGDSVFTLDDPAAPRRYHTGTLLAPDGRVLLAGGLDPTTLGAPLPAVHDHFELYDPQQGEFTGPFPMDRARALHTATRLEDGRVLLLGGIDAHGNALADAALFDPATDTVQAAAPMAHPRVRHTATRLADGRVLVVGGSAAAEPSHPLGYPESLALSAAPQTELFDPATGAWSPGPALANGRTAHHAERLESGEVLIAGGVIFPPAGSPATTASCLLFDPGAGSLAPTAAMPAPRAFHSGVRMQDGRVLVTGGAELDLQQVTATGLLPTAVYAPETPAPARWSAGPPLPGIVIDGKTVCICRSTTIVVELPSTFRCGDIIYSGGGGLDSIDLPTGASSAQTALYTTDAALGGFAETHTSLVDRPQTTLTVEGDGARILSSGAPDFGAPSSELNILDF